MKKKFMYLACAAAAAMMLTACGGGGKDVEIDMEALASDLLETVTSDSLSQTSSDMLSSIYFYDGDKVDEAVAYTSSGATSCEIAVVKSKDASDTSEIEKNFQTRVDNQAELYASYNAPEAERLENDAITESAGAYTVLCVCDDPDAAEEVLEEYGF